MEQALSGGALPPRQLESSEKVIEAVRHQDGMIGYLPEAELQRRQHPGARTLRVESAGGEVTVQTR